MTQWITLDQAERLTGRDEAEIYIAVRRGHITGTRMPDSTWLLSRGGVLVWARTAPQRDYLPENDSHDGATLKMNAF